MPEESEVSKDQDVEVEKPAEETEKLEEHRRKKAPEEPARQKSSKIEKKIFTYYKIENKTIERQRPFCERCGPGYFMADHGNRYTCGHCGFTRYKQNQ